MTTHRLTTGRHDNSATALFHRQPTRRHDHWPTRQVTIFLKTHRHSPTLTDRDFHRKRVKRNIFFSMSILLYFWNEHIATLLSVNTNTCTCVMASFSLYCWDRMNEKPVAILINRKPKCPGKMYKKSVIHEL